MPQALFDRPVNLFVAAFIGSPAMNLVGARSATASAFAGHVLPLPPGAPLRGMRGDVVLGVRPTAFALDGRSADGLARGSTCAVELVEELGDEARASFAVDAPRVPADAVRAADDAGEDERLLADDRRARFIACLDGRRARSRVARSASASTRSACTRSTRATGWSAPRVIRTASDRVARHSASAGGLVTAPPRSGRDRASPSNRWSASSSPGRPRACSPAPGGPGPA